MGRPDLVTTLYHPKVSKKQMLTGEIATKIDTKGRTAFPKKFREAFAGEIILTRGFEGTLVIVDKTRWDIITREVVEGSFINADVRDSTRFLVGGAQEIELDAQGRFVIPKALRQYAELDSDIVFIGLINWIEVWDKAKWENKVDQLAKNVSEVAQRLTGI